MPEKFKFKLSPAKFRAACDSYFECCEESSRKPTAAGLCFALGITPDMFMRLLRSADRGEARGKNREYAELLKMAQLRLLDDIEQRSDSMSVSRAKLPVYSAFPGEKEAPGGVTVKIELGGMKKGEEPFD